MYRWQLEHHLLEHFGPLGLDEITRSHVKEYALTKRAGGDLPANSILATITPLSSIREDAVDAEIISRNVAADQMGHIDPSFTLKTYAQAVKHRQRLTKAEQRAYDEALDWARMGTNATR